jgi:hypothetical protein
VKLSSSSSGFDARPIAACCPASGLFIVKTIARRKALITKAFRKLLFTLTWPGAYNSTVMRIAKYTYPPLVLIFSLGLLSSQVCGVICSISGCSASGPAPTTAKIEQAGHCHRDRSSSSKGQSSEDQHRCPAHESATSILPSDTISIDISHHALQPVAAEPVPSLDVLFDLARGEAYRGGHFRSPPWRPQFTVLRV